MVKPGFLKTITKNMPLKKSFIILGLLIILTIVLFFSLNNYSIENLTPLGPVIDVMLWTDSMGSMSNSFVNTDWLELINTYKGFPNINFGQRKISEMVKYFEPEKHPQFKGWDEPTIAQYIPCITILVDDKGVKSFLGAGAPSGGFFTGPSLTLQNVKKALGNVFSKNYEKLYSNKGPNVGPPMPAMPAMSAPVAAPAAAPVAAPAAAPVAAPAAAPVAAGAQNETPSWLKFPGT
jgi:hypothetical protein